MLRIATFEPTPRHYTFGSLLLVGLGAAGGGAMAAVEPGALLIVVALCAAVAAAAAAYWLPGAVFAAYLSIPFYKAALQPYLPIDLTLILAVLNMIQIPIMFFRIGPASTVIPIQQRVWSALIPWLILTALIVFSVVYAPDIDTALTVATNWVVLVFLPLLACVRLASDRRFLTQLLWALFIIGSAVVVAGMWILPQVGEWPNDRLRVFGSHTIRVGQAALLVPAIAIPFVLRTSQPLVRFVSVLLIPLALIVAASSGSRGPLLMIGICAVIFSARRLMAWRADAAHRPAPIAPLRIIVIGFLASSLVFSAPLLSVASFLPQTSVERLESLSTIFSGVAEQDLSAEAPDDSTGDRLVAYDFAQEMFADRPLLGWGTASFSTLVPLEENRLLWPQATAHPHNLLLQAAAEYGLVGLFVLAVLIVSALRRGFQLVRDPLWNTVTILFVFFLLGAMVSTEMIDNRMLWGLMMLLHLAPDSGRGQPPADMGDPSWPKSLT